MARVSARALRGTGAAFVGESDLAAFEAMVPLMVASPLPVKAATFELR
jgi:hypothetical protein